LTGSLRSAVLVGVLVIFGHVSGSHAEPAANAPAKPTLESIMREFAASGGIEARFHESRQLSILNDPIESAGTLYFAPPDQLARLVSEPGKTKLVVSDSTVTFQDETGVQTFALDSSEVARALLGNTTVLLRGDIELLRSQYEVEFHVDVADGVDVADRKKDEIWTLDLVPRDPVVRKILKRLRVQGKGGKLVRMESIETSGDVTVTTFSEVKVGVEFSPEAHAEIFSIDSTR
jgi:outer membrane lipoprotein-sorting protein